MRGGVLLFLMFVIAFLLLIDVYAFRGVRILTSRLDQGWRVFLHILYWLVPLLILLLIGLISLHFRVYVTTQKFRILYFLIGFFVLFYVPKLVFIAFQLGTDIIRFAGWILAKLSSPQTKLAETASVMSRSEFLTKIGIVVSFIPFLSVIHGITKGRFNYQIKNFKLYFENLPPAFNGFRLLHISDWHIGSFLGQYDKVVEVVKLINVQKADLILFTGDIVNNVAEELREFIPALREMKSKYGVYSILGNHDYGDYIPWESEDAHKHNMNRLYDYQKQAGLKLLRNSSVTIECNGDVVGIAGVENWGLSPFQQYGDLNKALKNIQSCSFKILMSHDPSHWDAQVLRKAPVDLTLSGHTHGMQFGINLPGFKWSPIQWKYPRWAGLYEEGKQKLYVNVGIGYIAFPGRVGFLPEITVFELYNK
jgi:predicted MPP superfamily phosphohydrolase